MKHNEYPKKFKPYVLNQFPIDDLGCLELSTLSNILCAYLLLQ